MKNLRIIGLLIGAALLLGLLNSGCASTIPNRDPSRESFPAVTGTSLLGEDVALPASLAGQPSILLVGYLQGAQFDLDRWLMGLIQADLEIPILEVPTIPALVPTMISGWIDDGMRSGIPEEDWGSVVTLYGSAAAPVAELTGTEFGRQARVLLLDSEGRVDWFHDRGYSASKALELAQRARTLAAQSRD